MKLQAKKQLPVSHEPYTDKYFLRTNEILKKEEINPLVAMKVFARGHGAVAGLDEAVEVLLRYSDLEKHGEIWVINSPEYKNKEPLMIIKGPVQSFVELETMYLGVLSHAISEANGFPTPDTDEIAAKVTRLKEIYKDIPITYFGARHYHYSLDHDIAKIVLENGGVAASTDIGAFNIGQKGVGTTPHILTVALASLYGKDVATLMTAKLFDKHMNATIPRMILVDTFNKELTDSLLVARYFGNRRNLFRIDTCGENIGEGGSLYNGEKARDPEYKTGTGVAIELARNLRLNLIRNGFGDYTDTFLSSGFGDEEKARAFVQANEDFKRETGYSLFIGVGIGEISSARFCTGDLFEVDGKPLSKTGREVTSLDYSRLKRVV
ncbi:MAG: nicotinate phosphoribosyltransferase [Thaumarchaeota archaeon]|nr:nicotinate phosphoribosyltransferase [Nitrososphaerota archaeon]